MRSSRARIAPTIAGSSRCVGTIWSIPWPARLRRAVVGRPVEIRADADRLECWQDGRIVGPHARPRLCARQNHLRSPAPHTGPGSTTRRSAPLLADCCAIACRALNAAPFEGWNLPIAIRRVQRELERRPGGGRPHSGHCCAMPCRAVNGRDPCRRALRWPGRGRSSLYRGAVAQRSFRRSSPLCSNRWRINGSMLNILAGHHAGGVLPARRTAGGVLPARRTAAAPDDLDAGCAEAGLRAHRPWRPL